MFCAIWGHHRYGKKAVVRHSEDPEKACWPFFIRKEQEEEEKKGEGMGRGVPQLPLGY